MAHETTIAVRFSELDPYGHVNHAVYLTYFEQARCEALQHCGIPIELISERGYQLVVTELTARFVRSAGPGDLVTVETRLAEQRRARGTWAQRIRRDGVELVTADITIGVTDRNGRPSRPPDWLFPALQPLLD